MNYRNAIADDLPEMLRLFAECCPDFESVDSDLARQTARQRRKHLLHAQFILVAQSDHDIAGFATLRDNQVDLLYVHRNYEHHGVGEELLSKLGYIVKLLNTTTMAANGTQTVRPFLSDPISK